MAWGENISQGAIFMNLFFTIYIFLILLLLLPECVINDSFINEFSPETAQMSQSFLLTFWPIKIAWKSYQLLLPNTYTRKNLVFGRNPSSIYSWFLKPLSVLHSRFPTKKSWVVAYFWPKIKIFLIFFPNFFGFLLSNFLVRTL